jgi:hypothetical protein
MLSREAIQEFQEIYLKEYGETITPERAAVFGSNLIHLYKTLLKPQKSPARKGKT